MTADEIMTEDVATVRDNASIHEVLELLSTLTIRHVPVTDDGQLVGMISDRDLRDAGLSLLADESDIDRLGALQSTPVSEVMRTDLVVTAPDADVADVIELMLEEKVGAIPVVDDRGNQLVGIISYMDILRAAAKLF